MNVNRLNIMTPYQSNSIKSEDGFKEKILFFNNDALSINGEILHKDFHTEDYQYLTVSNLVLEGGKFWDDFSFSTIKFIGCTFKNIMMDHWDFIECSFENCIFDDIDIFGSDFIHCNLIDCDFIDCAMNRIRFSNCSFNNIHFSGGELIELNYRYCEIETIFHKQCTIASSNFEHLITGPLQNFNFTSCQLSQNTFVDVDLRKSNFFECEFEHTSFINSTFGKDLFTGKTLAIDDAYCSIDFQTLLSSEDQLSCTLKNVFGIHSDIIKNYVSDLTTPINYHKVFISYSFEDKLFARRLNEALLSKGIATFLWEKDAPGGRPLKSIMSENIAQYDKLLFIASENSIKSPACQFELTEGRIRQDKLWKTIYFPIHIDDFLFNIKKHEVRPKERQEEIWANIEELRDINSTDFSAFQGSDYDKSEFLNCINKLVKDLKK